MSGKTQLTKPSSIASKAGWTSLRSAAVGGVMFTEQLPLCKSILTEDI